MRYQHALLLLIQISAAVTIALPESTAPEYGVGVLYRRDLLGDILAGPAGTDSLGPVTATAYTSPSIPPSRSIIYPGLKDLGGLLTDPVLTTASSTGKVDPTAPSMTSIGVTSFASSSNPSLDQIAPTSTTRAASYPTAVSTSMTEEPDAENNTWKIIGIAFIAILIITIAITFSMFFDRWWKVAQEILCCKGRPDGIEEFIPDWEKQTWEVNLGAEKCGYNQRASFVSVGSDTGGDMETLKKSADHTMPTLPASALRIVPPSDPRELPWDAKNLHECALHRQFSKRSG